MSVAATASFKNELDRVPSNSPTRDWITQTFQDVIASALCAQVGMSAAEMVVTEAVYGYTSSVTSTPRCRASSTSRSVSTVLPHDAFPTTLW